MSEKTFRIAVDNDGGDVFCEDSSYDCFVSQRLTSIRDGGATTVFYTTQSSGFSVFTHRTKYGTVWTSAMTNRAYGNITSRLIVAGTDALEYTSRFCRENGLELFWTMRMNDTHDAAGAAYGPVLFYNNNFKYNHPDAMIGTREERPKHGAWTAVDYAREDVRELAYRFCEEVVENYDIDGISLDFFRHPVFFRTTARGENASEEEVAMMTALIRRIHDMLKPAGEKRGRKYPLAVRVPDSAEYARAIGLDIETWMREGLIDIYIPTSYLQLNDWEYSVELGHRYGVTVLPSLDESRVRDAVAKARRTDIAGMCARVSNVRYAGADGVVLFNLPSMLGKPQNEETSAADTCTIRDVADVERLKTVPRYYFVSYRGVGAAAGGNLPHQDYIRIPTLNPGAPLDVDTPVELPIWIGESTAKTATLRITLAGEEIAGTVSLNGERLGQLTQTVTEISFSPTLLQNGKNRICVHAPGCQWLDAEIDLS